MTGGWEFLALGELLWSRRLAPPLMIFGFLAGAGDAAKLRRLFRFCLLFLCAVSLGMILLVCLPAGPLLGLITPDRELVELGIPMLRWQASGGVFACVVMLGTCLCQASGKAAPAMALSLSRQGVVFVLVLLIASAAAGYTGVLASQVIADFLSALLALWILARVLPKKGTN